MTLITHKDVVAFSVHCCKNTIFITYTVANTIFIIYLVTNEHYSYFL